VYKKKKVEISFEVVEWVNDDNADHTRSVDEWMERLKVFVGCLDYRSEYEVEDGYLLEYEIEGTNIHGDPIHGKLKNTQAKIEITDAGCLIEDETNKDELWQRYGDSGYYQFKAFDTFVNKAEEIIEDVHGVSYDDMVEIGALARKIAASGI
jgi:hypothetical protein